MPVWRLQTMIGADTAFQRDRLVINPVFNSVTGGSSPEDLANDWADAVVAWIGNVTPREVRVKAYDAEGATPVFPEADVIRNADAFPAATCPREVAICLSFYSERNLPRQRGRLYVPVCIMGGVPTARPTFAFQNRVAEIVPAMADLGGIDVDWSVFSRADDTARAVSHWWIDNEWDTIRSRGLDATERVEGTVDE